METQITSGIKISVQTSFEGIYIKNTQYQYAFSYQITIENQTNQTVQLLSRYWQISDSLNPTEIIEGEGVIGQKPIIAPNQKHTYQSGCILLSSIGAMQGHYNMVNFNTNQSFKVQIPVFKLNAPFILN
jgi:ApaG protein